MANGSKTLLRRPPKKLGIIDIFLGFGLKNLKLDLEGKLDSALIDVVDYQKCIVATEISIGGEIEQGDNL